MPRAPAAPTEFILDGCQATISVRFLASARRITLRINQAKRTVCLSAPIGCSVEQARAFAGKQIAWINERLDRLEDSVPFADGALIPVRGTTHRVRFMPITGLGAPVQLHTRSDAPPELLVNHHRGLGPRRLEAWLRAQARADLADSVVYHAGRLGVSARSITVRDQTSRWGSCSSTGALSFSWRLILAEPFVLDYVAAHEVAHLREMNHSPRFWALVAQTMPRYQDAKAWLRAHGTGLHRYGVQETQSSATQSTQAQRRAA